MGTYWDDFVKKYSLKILEVCPLLSVLEAFWRYCNNHNSGEDQEIIDKCLKRLEKTFFDQVVKKVYICDEDVLNLKNAVNRLMDADRKLRDGYEPLEIFTIQNIIKQFED